MTSLMVTFRTFSFLDFLADLLQKSISGASNLFACCVIYKNIKLRILNLIVPVFLRCQSSQCHLFGTI
jgi:hypothetical protein